MNDTTAPQAPATKRRRRTAAPLEGVGSAGPAAEPDLLTDSLAYAIKRAQVRCDEALVELLDDGISPARLSALSTVGANPGISQAALSGRLNIAGPSVVKVVDELERMGLMRRDPSSDRRVYALRLTNKGLADLRRYHAIVERYEAAISTGLSAAERTQLLRLLDKVAPNQP